ncbi:MAG: helix-turn-helix transcriptional regulator [Bacteroidales bacterium]|nr:helix-turn-helix transcriptional regulator [Bacteroidales bacterium]
MAIFEGFCPVRNILSQIGDKWSVLAMVALQKYGVCRFRDFQKDMPDVSRKMLSQTLRRLEDFHLVTRTVYPEVPPRVEYRLTDLGASFQPALNGIIDWALSNRESLVPDERNRSGHAAYGQNN